jgi:hypothetical protein
MNAPDGMISAANFAKAKGYSLDETIGMIRSGFYDGRLVEGSGKGVRSLFRYLE